MRSTLLIAIGLVIGVPTGGASQDLGFYCHEEGRTTYDRLACSGIRLLASGEAEMAVDTLSEALATHRFEFPNFELLAPLAVAHHRADHQEAALRALELARITLNIFTGYYECRDAETGFDLFTRGTPRLNEELTEEAVRRMCGAAYEYVYEPQHLERHLLDARLIELFFAAREEVIGGEPIGG